MSGGPLVGSLGYSRWISVGTSNLVMFVWCDTDDGLTILLQVIIGIILLNGIIWNNYGSVESRVSNHCWYSSPFL